ncbi:Xaa-Pro dipeptidyl-peptidase [Pirellula sp. SH-Sr6A]|uniref:Xaa-Pro dipeptidyl-peptidase n=1 Tax=Pirellula sp. SH-Sr6A TaxID=1632865 RepID=UPI001F0A0C25|nr:Xaa-Pro dipeptidyl-peptidase [Pirellula sp. SH-Sr6A]
MKTKSLPLYVCLASFSAPAIPLSAQQPALPRFENGEAQVVEAFAKDWIQHDLWVEAPFDSDGDGKQDRMHVAVTRPAQTDSEKLKVPVIYQSSPYYAGMGSNDPKHMWNPKQQIGTEPPKHEDAPEIDQQSLRPVLSRDHLKEWVPRGFAVVHSSSPGTGLSQGCPTVGGDNESLAPKAVIDWLNGRAKGYTTPDGDEEVKAYWSTGKVGMTGTSYNGTLALAAATTGVEGLEAIIPVAPNTSYYHYYRSNGLVRHPGGYIGEDIDVLYDFINSGNPDRRDYCNCEVRDKGMLKEFDRKDGNYNAFWKERDYLHELGPMKAAMLMAHAFNDWNVMPEHSIRIYEAVKAKGLPTQLFMHQGGHGGQPPVSQMNRWFTRYLYNIPNDVEKDPPVRIVREGKPRDEPESYANYPHPDSKPVSFRLEKGGISSGALVRNDRNANGNPIVPIVSQGKETLIDNFSFPGSALAQAEWSNHRLLYSTKPLEKEVHISGTPRIRLRVASNKPSACLSVWLVALPWTGSKRITDDVITRGWADPKNAKSLENEEPLVPGEFRTVEFHLQPEDQIIPAGESIGLMLFASDRDFTLWQEPGTELSIDLDQSELILPIVSSLE